MLSNEITKKETRRSSFEFLRIISMFMIVLHHLVIHGVIDNPAFTDVFSNGSNINRFFAWLFFPGGEVGVALFFMITGFFCINDFGIRIKKVFFEVVFYAYFSVILFFILNCFGVDFSIFFPPEEIKGLIILGILFPIQSSFFWFATAYLILRLFLPIYNRFLTNFNKIGFIIFLGILFIALMQCQLFNVVLGYTKALFFYTVGGFIKKVSRKICNVKIKIIEIFVFCISWLSYALLKYYDKLMSKTKIAEIILKIFPSCIFVIICAICLFLIFLQIDFGEKKVLNTISATTFGIYLIHDSRFMRYFLWCNVVKVQNLYMSIFFPIFHYGL